MEQLVAGAIEVFLLSGSSKSLARVGSHPKTASSHRGRMHSPVVQHIHRRPRTSESMNRVHGAVTELGVCRRLPSLPNQSLQPTLLMAAFSETELARSVAD